MFFIGIISTVGFLLFTEFTVATLELDNVGTLPALLASGTLVVVVTLELVMALVVACVVAPTVVPAVVVACVVAPAVVVACVVAPAVVVACVVAPAVVVACVVPAVVVACVVAPVVVVACVVAPAVVVTKLEPPKFDDVPDTLFPVFGNLGPLLLSTVVVIGAQGASLYSLHISSILELQEDIA